MKSNTLVRSKCLCMLTLLSVGGALAERAEAPDGAPVDGGNTVWFADGNEITYSGVRDQLGPDGKTLALPGVITGKIQATRVTMNTTTQVP